MKTVNFKPNHFLLHWVMSSIGVWLVAAVACVVAWAPIAILISVLDQYPMFVLVVRVISMLALFTVPGLSIGYVIGDMQSNPLRDFLHWDLSPQWVRHSSIGGMLGCILAMGFSILFGTQFSDRMQWMIILPLFVTPISLMQWHILRDEVRNAWMWILANVVGAIVFSGLFFSIDPTFLTQANPLASVLMWLVAAGAFGAITGIVILWLYEHPRHQWDDEDAELAPVYLEVRNRDDS